ncbi:MAG: complex I NDUFA9 subunit family protein [Bdellovibrionales bacterium]
MNKIATVFGGSGFIGRQIVSRLVQAGYSVRVPTRVLAHAEPLRQLGTPGVVTPILLDVHDVGQVGDAVANADVVVNCIGVLTDSRHQPFNIIQGEVPGIIARAANAAGVKHLVHISAIGADANSPSAYARSKAAGEGVVRAIFPQAVILRPSIVFGPEDGFFNRFAKMAMVSPVLPLLGGGRTRMQPVYVADVAAAALQAIVRTDARGKVFELGGPAIYTFRQLMQTLLFFIRRRRFLVPVPWGLALLMGRILEKLPGKMLTRDQVVLLQRDNVVNSNGHTLEDIGVAPTALEAVLPTYLDVYLPKGRFQ